MTPIHITIILALSSGFGIIAYRTPKIYQKIYWPLFCLFMLSQVVTFTWTMCRYEIYDKIYPFISTDRFQEARQAFDLTGIDSSFYWLSFAFLAYIGFLRWLTDEVIKHSYNKKPEEEG